MARSFLRKLGTLDYAANSVSRLDIPRNHVFKGLLLRLTGTLTISGGDTDGTLHDEEPMSLIREVRFVRNGSQQLQVLDGGSLYTLASYNRGTPPDITRIGAAAAAAYDFEAYIPLDFALLRMMKTVSEGGRLEGGDALTFFRSVGNSSVVLEITWGSEANLVNGGNRTETLSATQIEVYGAPELMDLSGNFADKNLYIIQSEVTATTDNHRIELPTGPMYRRIFMKCSQQLAGPAAGSEDFDLTDAIVNNVRLVIDGTLALVERYDWPALRAHNKEYSGLEAWQSGYAVIDFTEDGLPQGMIVTDGASSFELVLDVTDGVGSNYVRVIPEVVLPSPIAVEV